MRMPMKRIVLSLMIIFIAAPVHGQRPQAAQQDTAQEIAAAQMRRIATDMKACPEEVQSQTELATYYAGPPTNLEWNVEPSKTPVRSPFQGVVTFSLPERSEETETAKHSKKLHKQYMDAELYQIAYGHPGHYRYDFDLGNDSPDLVKALFIDDKTNESRPVSSSGHVPTCWEKAARTVNGRASQTN
jgi:hypothetical protein